MKIEGFDPLDLRPSVDDLAWYNENVYPGTTSPNYYVRYRRPERPHLSRRFRLKIRARVDWDELLCVFDIHHLPKRGIHAFYGLCPFHDEKTPSIRYSCDGQFTCFGCGERGDMVDFIVRVLWLTFSSEVKKFFQPDLFPLLCSPASEEALDRDDALYHYLNTPRSREDIDKATRLYRKWRYPTHYSS